MLQPVKTFAHLDGTVGSNYPAYKTLIELQPEGVFPEYRAILYNNGPFQGIRTALWIELGGDNSAPYPFHEFKGLWLIELDSLKVTIHGSQQRPSQKSIGGRVIHDVDVLDINAQWLTELAVRLASDLYRKVKEVDPQDLEEITSTLVSVEGDLLKSAIRSFVCELDDNTIAVLEAEGTGRNDVYNHYASADVALHRNRLQAAESFPWFSRVFRGDWLLRQAIDSGKPLIGELASRYQVQPCTIKYFREFNPPRVLLKSRTGLIKSIDCYSPEYFPATPEDHEVFIGVSDTLDDLACTFQVPHIQLARPFINGWKSGIEQLEASLDRKLKLELIFDMAQASFYYGVKPALQEAGIATEQITHPPAKWFQLWFGHYGLKRLLEMAYSWERVYGYFSLRRLGMTDDDTTDRILDWPQLSPSSYCHGPYRVVELTSQHELETEGRKLNHCIASYGIKCLVSGSFIYSIRDRLGNFLSTFEIQFDQGVPLLRQHKAMSNQEPEKSEQAVVKRFVNKVLSGVSSDRLHKIQRQRYGIELRMKGLLHEPDSFETELSDNEKNQLGSMVEFTHPSTVLHIGIAEYLLSKGIVYEKRPSGTEAPDYEMPGF